VTASIAEHKAEIMDSRRYGVQRLELFGSAAEGRGSPESDLGFPVDFGSRPTPGYADAYFGLGEALEEHRAPPGSALLASEQTVASVSGFQVRLREAGAWTGTARAVRGRPVPPYSGIQPRRSFGTARGRP
jgi:predicted nucleotidyltransferase